MINLSQNENPNGCSPLVHRALVKSKSHYSHYPHRNVLDLQKKIADILCLDYDQVLMTNGSSEALELIIRTFSIPGSEVILPQYAFYFYKIVCHYASLIVKEVANNGHQDVAVINNLINQKTRFIILTNPSNPLGTFIKFSDIKVFMQNVPSNVIVIIDEAYYEYMVEQEYQSAIILVNQYKNLIITRTFSKAYGLAGLRIGYCVGHGDLLEAIHLIKNPHSVNNLAIIAAKVAFDDQPFLHQTQRINQEEFNQLGIRFKNMNLPYLNKTTNFITIDLNQNAKLFAEKLLKHSIVVKTLDEYNLPHHIRVSVGLSQENVIFLKVLEKVLLQD